MVNFRWSLRPVAAIQLLEQLSHAEVVLPAQALGEPARALTRKAQRSASQAPEAVMSWVDTFEVAGSTWFAFQAALDLTVDHQLPMWNALILAVAAENRCRLLLSEDFQNGFTWCGVTVVDPFGAPRLTILERLLRT